MVSEFHTARPAARRRLFFYLAIVSILGLVLSAGMPVHAQSPAPDDVPTLTEASQTPLSPVLVAPNSYRWPTLEESLTTSGATPPPGTNRGVVQADAAGTLIDVPPYVWYHGCGPTTAGMVLGFWNAHGFNKLFPGSAASQSDTVNQVIASDGHYADYSLPLDDLAHSATILPDKSEDPVGDEHADNSIADFMKTSQSKHLLRYGWSSSRWIADAFENYVHYKAPEYSVMVRFLTMEDGLTWDLFRSELQAGRPVMLIVDTDGDGETDHAGTAIGYDDSQGQTYAVYDTWDTDPHWYEFKKMAPGQQWGIYGAALVNLGSTFLVNSTNDEPDANPGDGLCRTLSGFCTLRAGVMEANANPGHDTILLPSNTYTLTLGGLNENLAATGDLDITQNLSIIGDGIDKTIIDGGKLDTVFSIGDLEQDGVLDTPVKANQTQEMFMVYFSGVTIRNGLGGIAAYGGGTFTMDNSKVTQNDGTGIWTVGPIVNLTGVSVTDNHAPDSIGGIHASSGKLTITTSTIQDNSGSIGGISAGGGMLLTTSTVAENTGSLGAGGIGLTGSATIVNSTIARNAGSEGGGIWTSNDLVLINTTIAANNANGTGSEMSSGAGGGIYTTKQYTVILNETLLANNESSEGSKDCSGSFTSGGYNLIGSLEGCTLSEGPGDIIGIDAKLAENLADNGGPTRTMALLAGSPAIDAGNPSGCTDESGSDLTYDQRYSTRPMDGNGDGVAICDIGAFEVQVPSPTATPSTGTPPSPTCTAPVTPATPTSTKTPTATQSPTTPTVAPPTVTPSATGTPQGCYEAILNGGFEKDEAWYLPVTKYQAGYDQSLIMEAAANYSTDEVHSGGRSMRTGIIDAAKNIYSYSSAWQQVAIPANATSASFSFWAFPQAINGIDGFDVQLALVLDTNKLEVERPVNQRSDGRAWKSFQFDFKKYAGRTIWVYFGTYNNGWGGTMAMFVDDVSLRICKP